jgi:hypothetical protein
MFYVDGFRLRRFRCMDIERFQFCIHLCTWRNVDIEDVRCEGKKDGVHFGPGRGGSLRNVTCRTFDDAIALNAEDYVTANPELGDIEQLEVCDAVDLPDTTRMGFLARLLTGSWRDYRNGMQVKRGDSCVHEGFIYRCVNPGGELRETSAAPSCRAVDGELTGPDGVTWRCWQRGEFTSCNIRDVTFRRVRLEKARTAFCVQWGDDDFNRAVYPGTEDRSEVRGLVLEDIDSDTPAPTAFIAGEGNLRSVRITGSRFRNIASLIDLRGPDRGAHRLEIELAGNRSAVPLADLIVNDRPNLEIAVHATSS